MFDRLTSSLSSALKSLSGRGRLTDDNIADTVREVRLALLDADVALEVVKTFTDAVKARAIGVEVTKSLTPGQAFIKVVHEELTRLMGEPSSGLNLRAQRPVVVMLAGLQGAGKTTSAGKLARWLIEKQHKKVLMVSTDVYRPAAILQLETLAAQVGAGFREIGQLDLGRVAFLHPAYAEVAVKWDRLDDRVVEFVLVKQATHRPV